MDNNRSPLDSQRGRGHRLTCRTASLSPSRPGESTYARITEPGIRSTTGGFHRMIILPERTDTGK
ncbi:hypothetical protein DLD82_09440 [Methanospirillum stamsii]|uniref:Uncharacterized protein n=1 Tax=Methanospirillum stamsii TaxID=1277351 RepID=A0A2V2NDT4_9EURY|nr:hypothetical protein DLD82_09440 [Methanospirillum stamsii]